MVTSTDATQFTNVDAAQDPAALVSFLDARTTIEGEREVKDLELAMLQIAPGVRVLDVGCGTGDDAREIASLVGPQGKVVGLDASAVMVAEARKRTGSTRLPVEFREGNALHLDFPDDCFDRVRTDRVLVHLKEPEQALAEMVRVVTPGGRIVVSELDMDLRFIDSRYREITRKVLTSYADRSGSAWAGRSLPRMLREAGLSEIECVPRVIRTSLAFLHRGLDGHLANPSVAGLFHPGELDAWWRDLAQADAAGHFHNGICVFTAVGRK